jgi:hypothetical protein
MGARSKTSSPIATVAHCASASLASLSIFVHEEHVVLSHLFYAIWDELLLPFRLDALSLSDSHAIQYDRQRLTDVKTAQNFLHPSSPDASTARHIERWYKLVLAMVFAPHVQAPSLIRLNAIQSDNHTCETP